MKKAILSLMLTVSLFVSTTFIPANANAVLLGGIFASANDNEDTIHNWGTVDWALCLVFLPICLFEKEIGQSGMSRDALAKNNYSSNEIDTIMASQAELVLRLSAANKKLSIDQYDTKASIDAQIRGVYPEVATIYVDFLTQQVGL